MMRILRINKDSIYKCKEIKMEICLLNFHDSRVKRNILTNQITAYNVCAFYPICIRIKDGGMTEERRLDQKE